MSFTPSDVPAYASAVAAIASAVTAFIAIREARRSANAEERANSLTVRRELYAQSRTISAYEVEAEGEHMAHAFVIHNGSDAPVYEVGAFLTPFGHDVTKPLSMEIQVHRFPIIPPGSWVCTFSDSIRGMHKIPSMELAFTDAAGRHWVRDSSGILTQADADMPSTYCLPLPFTHTELAPLETQASNARRSRRRRTARRARLRSWLKRRSRLTTALTS